MLNMAFPSSSLKIFYFIIRNGMNSQGKTFFFDPEWLKMNLTTKTSPYCVLMLCFHGDCCA